LPERGRRGPAASIHSRRAVTLIAAASQPRSSPRTSAALARLWLAPALAAFVAAFPAARLAGGLALRPGALPVPHNRGLPRRRRESR